MECVLGGDSIPSKYEQIVSSGIKKRNPPLVVHYAEGLKASIQLI